MLEQINSVIGNFFLIIATALYGFESKTGIPLILMMAVFFVVILIISIPISNKIENEIIAYLVPSIVFVISVVLIISITFVGFNKVSEFESESEQYSVISVSIPTENRNYKTSDLNIYVQNSEGEIVLKTLKSGTYKMVESDENIMIENKKETKYLNNSTINESTYIINISKEMISDSSLQDIENNQKNEPVTEQNQNAERQELVA